MCCINLLRLNLYLVFVRHQILSNEKTLKENYTKSRSFFVACGRSCFSRDRRLSGGSRPRERNDTLEEAIFERNKSVRLWQNREGKHVRNLGAFARRPLLLRAL